MPNEKYDILVELKAITENFNKKIANASKEIAKIGKGARTSLTSIHDINGKLVKFSANIDSTGRVLRKTTSIVEDSRKRFHMYYLSMLFGGMVIKRTMEGIAKTSISTFMKLTEGQTQASEGLNRISVAFEYLRYSIGSALGEALLPYIPNIVEFISMIADFVQRHPELVFWSIAGALAFGSVTLAIGQWGLFLGGMTRFVESGIGAKFVSSLKAMGAISPLFLLLGKAIIAIVGGLSLGFIFVKMWKSNFAGLGFIINNIIKYMLLFNKIILSTGSIIKIGLVDGFKFAFYRIGYYINKIIRKTIDMILTIIRAINRIRTKLGFSAISTSGLNKLKSGIFRNEVYYWHKADSIAKEFKNSVGDIVKDYDMFKNRVYATYETLTPTPTLNPMKVIRTPIMPRNESQITININAQGSNNEELARKISEELDNALSKYGNLGTRVVG